LISCSDYFQQNNYTDLSGMVVEISWSVNLNSGNNTIPVNVGTQTFPKGSMIMLQMISGIVGLGQSSTIDDNDYLLVSAGTNFSLKNVPSIQEPNKQYFQLIVVATCISYTNNQTVAQQMNQSGIYNLTETLYDPLTNISYLQANYVVQGS